MEKLLLNGAELDAVEEQRHVFGIDFSLGHDHTILTIGRQLGKLPGVMFYLDEVRIDIEPLLQEFLKEEEHAQNVSRRK
jgi:hypothetical protein